MPDASWCDVVSVGDDNDQPGSTIARSEDKQLRLRRQ
jgi:hypothetical protein